MFELFRLAEVPLDAGWFDGEFEDLGLDEDGSPVGGGPLDSAVALDQQCFHEIIDDSCGHRLSNDDLMRLLGFLPMRALVVPAQAMPTYACGL